MHPAHAAWTKGVCGQPWDGATTGGGSERREVGGFGEGKLEEAYLIVATTAIARVVCSWRGASLSRAAGDLEQRVKRQGRK